MDGKLTGRLSPIGGLRGTLSIGSGTGIPYTGPTEFTPTDSAQTIEAAGFQFTENITINPIPSNYGLITWNGATLTVS